MLQDLQVGIDPDKISELLESALLSDSGVHKDSISFLATVLEIFLEPENSVHPNQDQDLNKPPVCEMNTGVHFSDKALENLIKLATQTESTVLHKPVYCLLKQQVSSTSNKMEQSHLAETHKDAISSNIDTMLKSLLSLRIDEPASQSPLSEPHPSVSKLLVSPSDTYMDDKLDKIYSCLNTSCAHNQRAKRILESSPITKPPSVPLMNVHRVSKKTLKKLLKHCTRHVSVVSGNVATLLFLASEDLLDYFQSHSLLNEICSRVTQQDMNTEEDSSDQEERLYLLRLLAAFLLCSKDDRWEDGLVCVRDLWTVCVDLFTTLDCADTLVGCVEYT